MDILIASLAILCTIFIWIFTPKYANPAKVMSIYWTIFIVAALIAWKNQVNWSYSGLVYIIIICFVFAIGMFAGVSSHKKLQMKQHIPTANVFYSNKARITLIICIILGTASSVMAIINNGFSISMLFDIGQLLQMNNSFAVARYSTGNAYVLSQQILMVFSYAAPLIGGYYFAFSKKGLDKIIAVTSFLPVVLMVATQNAKAGVIIAVVFWLSGFITAKISMGEKPIELTKKTVVILIAIIALFFVFMYLAMWLRVGYFDNRLVSVINQKFLTYSLGHMPAFDYWFSNNIGSNILLGGQYTFFGIADTLGIVERTQGVFNDFYSSGGVATNVYTALRGFVLDFGIYGGAVVMFFVGGLSGLAYRGVVQNGFIGCVSKCILAMTYAWILFSFTVSLWSYMTCILALVVFFAFLLLSHTSEKKQVY